MQNIRLLAVFLMLLSASSPGHAFSINAIPQPLDNEITAQLSEDLVDLSASYRTTTVDNFNTRISFPSSTILTGEDSRLLSKSKAYFFSSQFLKPGLSLPDIIFPFHTFL
ncbi:hypothetical protein [Gillisia limnaea]|uniref:Uncharacterized protein n=1 Tax=Gillisia limnaea (strain DSM 15749 / LMG 21470 / R-8282) TaxID=865937 RepID=H2BSY0_GILLR|nr:hypothetical protein [Gillisia limnaea]EHQ01510.1 hypothetical protein Gilli_0813 [Gillisia limnaea DSM 15749]